MGSRDAPPRDRRAAKGTPWLLFPHADLGTAAIPVRIGWRAKDADEASASGAVDLGFEVPDPAVRPPAEPTPEEALSRPVAQRFPPGHFYSPLPDTRELAWRSNTVWPDAPLVLPGVEWHAEEQVAFCDHVLAKQERLLFALDEIDDRTYFTRNAQYPVLDAWVLEGMLRDARPRRMIEVGAGFSTRVTARVNRECFGSGMTFTCVEPYPIPGLADIPGVSEVRVEPVQNTPLELFDELGENDVLFIDTSHVAKAGSDVVWIYQQILPRLRPGVIVHLHDIFLPAEYPRGWVLDGWGWNEQYVVAAFLAFNDAFRVRLGVHYLLLHEPDALRRAAPGFREAEHAARGGAALWLQRV